MEKISGKFELSYEIDGVKTNLNFEFNNYDEFHNAFKSLLKQGEFIEKNEIEKQTNEAAKQTFEFVEKLFTSINNTFCEKQEEKTKERKGFFCKKDKKITPKKD